MQERMKLIEKYIDAAYESIHFLNQSLDELLILNQKREGYELKFLNDMFFKKYHYAMKNVFILEYCKLLETDIDDRNKNIASLAKLNWKIKANNDKTYLSYDDVAAVLLTLTKSHFYENIRKLRDKKVAHSEKHFPTFKIPAFTDEELEDAKTHVEILNAVFQRCADHYSVQFLIHKDDSTENFISDYSNYRQEFDKSTGFKFVPRNYRKP